MALTCILISVASHDGSRRQLLDTAEKYFAGNNTDSALTYYTLVADSHMPESPSESIREHNAMVATALNRIGIIHINKGNYHLAYKHLLEALEVCEKYGLAAQQAKVYNNIGNVYYHFKKYDTAISHYRKALSLCPDSVSAGYYNNLGQAMSAKGETDSAFLYFQKSLRKCRQDNRNDRLFALYNSMASLYRRTRQYDSAFHYYHLATDESRKSRRVEHEAQNLSDLGRMFLDAGNTDSARYYIGLSDSLASRHGFLKVMVANNLAKSEIEEAQGNIPLAFSHYKRYAALQDSVFNTDIFGNINQLERSYEAAKTNQRIERLVAEKKHKERVVGITLAILLLVSATLLYIYMQKRNLNKAYKALVEKNIEIKDYQEKSKKPPTAANTHDALFDRIQAIMGNTALICDPEFSVEKLAIEAGSNHTYVSRAIKNATGKSFRAFINGYRVSEAQRIFAESDSAKYTIESVALMVGFKSRNTFHDVFKDITGVSPNFYLKSLRERQKTA